MIFMRRVPTTPHLTTDPRTSLSAYFPSFSGAVGGCGVSYSCGDGDDGQSSAGRREGQRVLLLAFARGNPSPRSCEWVECVAVYMAVCVAVYMAVCVAVCVAVRVET